MALSVSLVACSGTLNGGPNDGEVVVLTMEELNFQPLNPARGDASPQAGVLWGDIREDVPSGMILKFANGFSSPPHIHNITYRGIVIEGGLHNDDPSATKMWMGPGSYWSQPAGEDHITTAQPGAGAVSFLEIMEGPYLVKPSSEAFAAERFPVNIHSSNLIWLGSQEVDWIDKTDIGPKISFLWGSPASGNPFGSLVKLPAGYHGNVSTFDDARLILIQGELVYQSRNLKPGSFIRAMGNVTHRFECLSIDCQIYIRSGSPYAVH